MADYWAERMAMMRVCSMVSKIAVKVADWLVVNWVGEMVGQVAV